MTLQSGENVNNSSSKIERIVRTITELKRDEPQVKIVIFSHWAEILTTVENALKENEIGYHSVKSASLLAAKVEEFKRLDSNLTCLLLPLTCGGKGLNLTEATHVFLVEPILNPGEQLQAVGRIHRMGQTRPTFIHRFVVKNTIEEAIFEQSKCDTWAFKNWTIENLRKLFRNKDHADNV